MGVYFFSSSFHAFAQCGFEWWKSERGKGIGKSVKEASVSVIKGF